MGESNLVYWTWLNKTLLSLTWNTRPKTQTTVWCFAEQEPTPATVFLRWAWSLPRVTLRLFDKVATEPGVQFVDLNALEAMPSDACDVLTVFRASMFVEDPGKCLWHLRRIVRPKGLVLIDWLHGVPERPMVALGAADSVYHATYAEAALLTLDMTREEFAAFIADCCAAGDDVTLDTYIPLLRQRMHARGQVLIGPEDVHREFTIGFRAVKYFRPVSGHPVLHILTGLVKA